MNSYSYGARPKFDILLTPDQANTKSIRLTTPLATGSRNFLPEESLYSLPEESRKSSYLESPMAMRQLSYRERASIRKSFNIIKLSEGAHLLEFNPKKYPDFKEKDVLELKAVFDYMDYNGTGILIPNDIKRALKAFGYNPTKETIYDIMAAYDDDESGGLSFDEFMKIMSMTSEKEKETEVQKVFKEFDRENKGYIDLENLKKMSRELGEDEDEDVLKEIIKRSSSSSEGKIFYKDFKEIMSKRVI